MVDATLATTRCGVDDDNATSKDCSVFLLSINRPSGKRKANGTAVDDEVDVGGGGGGGDKDEFDAAVDVDAAAAAATERLVTFSISSSSSSTSMTSWKRLFGTDIFGWTSVLCILLGVTNQ